MFSNNGNRSRAAWARGFMALFAMLAMVLGLMASTAAAAPFAYVTVTNVSSSYVSVIDTATNKVAATIALPVGSAPFGVAVSPDGKHAYVANDGSNNVSVIDTATIPPSVVATVPVGDRPVGVAVTPDGKHVYVANQRSNNVSVIDTATTPPSEVAVVPVGVAPGGIAVTPDGTHAYVVNTTDTSFQVGTVSVIDTATNTVVATVTVGTVPYWVAVTPDGKHAYVTNSSPSPSVSVIDTASNTVVATVAVGKNPGGVAISPDGTHAYVTNEDIFSFGGIVSVIDTATNTVEAATITVGLGPNLVGIVPPPPGVPFLAFNAVLNIDFGTAPNTDAFTLGTSFILSSTAPVFNPLTDPVTLQIGTFAVTIPAGSFKKNNLGEFIFLGVINGVTLQAVIEPTGTLRYNFEAGAQHASLTGTQNTVYVTLAIGGGSYSNSNSGATSVTAAIFGTAPSVKAAMSR